MKVAKRVDIKWSHHKKKWKLCEGIEVLTNPTVVIILQYMYQIITLYTLNLHNVICQLYLNKAEKIK